MSSSHTSCPWCHRSTSVVLFVQILVAAFLVGGLLVGSGIVPWEPIARVLRVPEDLGLAEVPLPEETPTAAVEVRPRIGGTPAPRPARSGGGTSRADAQPRQAAAGSDNCTPDPAQFARLAQEHPDWSAEELRRAACRTTPAAASTAPDSGDTAAAPSR